MSCMPTPRSKPSGELERRWPTYVCIFFFLLSSKILTTLNRFLYILYISVDANFKLKRKDRGLEDVELMPGWGPFVEESAYQDFISNYVDQPEASTVGF
jgi:hypothetical protein